VAVPKPPHSSIDWAPCSTSSTAAVTAASRSGTSRILLAGAEVDGAPLFDAALKPLGLSFGDFDVINTLRRLGGEAGTKPTAGSRPARWRRSSPRIAPSSICSTRAAATT
jgi:hypothetical protein